MLTLDHVQQIMPHLPKVKAFEYLPWLNGAMAQAQIDVNPQRMAAFLAQLAHESGEFRYREEVWGPTAQQLRYEPPSTLATKLGNVQKGDGYRYRGRGWLQVTGRANYKKIGQALGLDLVGSPDLAATPKIGFQTAAQFWVDRPLLNAAADLGDIVSVSRIVNGGDTGLEARKAYYAKALVVLAAPNLSSQEIPA